MKLFSDKSENGKWSLNGKILAVLGAVCLIAVCSAGVKAAVDGFEAAEESVTVVEEKDGICYMSDGSMQTEDGQKVVVRNCSLDGRDYYYIETEDGTLTTLDGSGRLMEENGTEYILYTDGSRQYPDGTSVTEETENADTESEDEEETLIPSDSENEEDGTGAEEENEPESDDVSYDTAMLPEGILEDEPESLEYDDVEISFAVTGAAAWDEMEFPEDMIVPLGTDADELNLPDCFILSGTYTKNYLLQGESVCTETEDADSVYVTIGWDDGGYDPQTEGEYVFTYTYDESSLGYSLDDSDGILSEMGVRYVTVASEETSETAEEVEADEEEIQDLGDSTTSSEKVSIDITASGDGVMSGTGTNCVMANSSFSLTANITGPSGSYRLNWTVNNTKVKLTDSTSVTVKVSNGSSKGSEVTVGLTVTDSAGKTYTAEYVYITVNSSLAIDAAETTSGNLLLVYAGSTVQMHAIHSSSIDESTISWISDINELNGQTGAVGKFTVSTADSGKYIQLSGYDSSTKKTVTSEKLYVRSQNQTASISVTDSDKKSISAVSFTVTEGYKKSTSQTITLTPENAESSFKMQTDSLPYSGSAISYTTLGSAGTSAAQMTVTLKGGSGLSTGIHNKEDNISIKYGFSTSIDYAGTVLDIPVNVTVLKPLQIFTPKAYRGDSYYNVSSGTDISITPTFGETALSDPQITYQWYLINDYSGSETYTVDDISDWTPVSGQTSRTLTQTVTGTSSKITIYAYELVAVDRCGTVSICDEPCVVLVDQAYYHLLAYTDSTDPEEIRSVHFDDCTEGYSISNIGWQTVTVRNNGNCKVTGLNVTGSTHFDITGFTKGMSLDKNETITLKIRPKSGLKYGTYTDTMMVTTDQIPSSEDCTVSISFNVLKLDSEISLSDYSLTFDESTEGYDSLEESDYREVSVQYIDDGTATESSSVDIAAPTFNNFKTKYSTNGNDWYDFITDYELKLNKSVMLRIYPITGLKANGTSSKTYTESTVFAEGLDPLSVSFTVNPKPSVAISVSDIEDDEVTLTAIVTGGTKPLDYSWTKQASGEETSTIVGSEKSLSVPADEAAKYTCTVTDDAGVDCSAYHNVDIYELSAAADTESMDSIDFGSLIEGYSVAPDAVAVLLTNKSTTAIRNITSNSQNDYIVSGLSDISTLAPGQTAYLQVRPKTGLKAGEHTVSLSFSSDLCTGADIITLKFTVTAKDQTLKVSPGELKFSDTTEGYTKKASAQSVTVTNIGNAKVTVSVPSPKNFKLSGWNSDKSLEAGKSFSFSISPAEGLSAGDKTEEIELKTDAENEDDPQTVKAVLNVNSAPKIKISGAMSVVSGGSLTLGTDVTGGTAPYTYKWSTGGTGASETISPTEDTSVKVTLTDAAGVTAEAEAGITVTKAEEEETEKNTGKAVVFGAKSDAKTEHSLSASVGFMDFGSMIAGYTSLPDEQAVTITNNGTVTETIAAPVTDHFRVTDMKGNIELKPGESVTLHIVPNTGLKTGSYTDHIDFTGDGKAMAGVIASFTVVNADGTLPLSDNTTFTELNYRYGSGKLNFDVVSDTDTPVIGVKETSSAASAVLTETGMQMLADGSDCNIRLTTKTINDSISEEEKSLIDDALVQYQTEHPGIKVGMYMDLTLEKQIDGGDWITVTETDDPVKLILDVPDELQSLGSEYYLFRAHSGVVTPIASWDSGKSLVSFETDKCSTYAICYVPESAKSSLSPLLTAESYLRQDYFAVLGFCAMLVVGLGIIAFLLIVLMRRINKDKNTDR